MAVFQRIRIKNNEGKSRVISIFGLPILRTDIKKTSNGSKKSVTWLLSKNNENDNSNNCHVFYLKVNRIDHYTYVNLQHWVDIADALNAKLYIICDKKKLQKRILKRIYFYSSNVEFIKSYKNKRLKNIVKYIATGNWDKACYAHLTTFYHAKKHGITNFWNIDADDTTFCMSPDMCAQAINQVEEYACNNNINVFSLDMWRSNTAGRHWSFGVTFVRDSSKCFNLVEEYCSDNWKNGYEKYVVSYNLDWFFTYLKDKNYLAIETFYIENCMYIHWGDFLYNILGSNVSLWHNGKIYYPIVTEIFGDKNLGILDISSDCIKFDIGIQKENCQNYAIKNLTCLTHLPVQIKRLHNVPY